MQLSEETRARIEQHLQSNRVVLFMKGTPRQPLCGFSARTAALLDSLLPDYHSVDVLEDEAIREGIKAFGNWPTIPQLYVDGELVGGCDIVTSMFNSGELHAQLGLEAPDRTPPRVTISDKAAEVIRAAMQGHERVGLHFQVDANWQSQFNLAPAQGHELSVDCNGITLLFDLASAQRADGAEIDWVETVQGEGLAVTLPKAPPPVAQMSVQELQQKMQSGGLLLVDVRTPDERQKAVIEPSDLLDAELMQRLEGLSKDTEMVFYCHTGNRSQVAAEHFRKQGFTAVHNLAGGIDAWSKEIDPEVPLY